MPNVSNLAYSVPSWKALDPDLIGELFDFADEIIHDDGALLLFHPYDNGDFRESIQDHFLFFWLHQLQGMAGSQPFLLTFS